MSRRFKTATQAHLDAVMARDLSELRVAVLMLDGVHFAGQCCVIALAVTADGTKVPVGIWLGDTENKTIVKALLADLVARGLSAEAGLLIVIDGAKALAAAVTDVFGDLALIQRCTIHKRRNVTDHLPKGEQAWIDRTGSSPNFNNERDILATNGTTAARCVAASGSPMAATTAASSESALLRFSGRGRVSPSDCPRSTAGAHGRDATGSP